MSDGGAEGVEERVLVLAPTARDAVATRDLLARAGIHGCVCATLGDVCREAAAGAGAALVTAEAVVGDADGLLAGLLRAQPPWSDLPLVCVTPPGDDSPRLLRALDAVGPMTLMKRPVQVSSLVSAVRAALRDRRRQYAARAFLHEREQYRVTLSSIGDAVIATDTRGRVTFMNAVAEELTRWDEAAARGRPLDDVFRIVNEATRAAVANPALRALAEGVVVGLANHTVLIARDGTERPLDDSAAPIRGADGAVVGAVLVFRDVTEKKEAEAAVLAREERYRVLVNATSDVVYRMSADWEVMYPLDGRGLVPSTAEPVRGWMRKNLPASEHARARAAIAAAVRGKHTFELEHRVTRADGSPGWTLSRAVPILDAAGEIVEWFGTARDITAQKHAQEALVRVTAESERQKRTFDTALSNTPDFVYLYGLDGRLTYANKALLDLWGKNLTEAVGKDFFDLGYPPELADRLQRQIRQVVETRQPLRDETPYTSEAGTRSYEYIFTPVCGDDGEVEAVAGSTRDITARKQVEEAIRASEERFRTTADHAPVLIWIADTTRAYVWFNRPWLEFTGRTLRQEHGDGWTDGVHPDDAARYARVYASNFDARTPFKTEYRLRRRDGAWRWVLVNGTPLYGPGGEFTGYIGSSVDVTDQKEAEDALRDADRKKDDFIALLAHELRNPLAPIRNGLQVIRLANDQPSRERARRMMDRQLAHMVRLIDDLLDVSRIGRNKMDLRRARVALADVVASAVETAGPAIEEAGHALTVSLPPRPVYLDADLTRLAQVFSNLLTNSAKYTARGGTIWLAAEPVGGAVRVSVRDTGIGIPADALPSIFNMFSQVDRPTERTSGGLGIGLALVKGLVEMHGGTVAAHSGGQEQGSEFTVTLPALGGQPAGEEPAAADPPPGPGANRRVLVVDDNRDGAESLAMMLGLLGNEVAQAHDGVEAVERAEHFRPEVVLMDVGMPRLDGLEATKRIRARPWGREMTIIALTGWGQEGDRDRSRGAGCDGHLVKPVNLADLERLMEQLRVDSLG